MLYTCGNQIVKKMYIQRNTYKAHSGKEYRTILLSEKYHENGKIKTRTVQNLSNLPEEVITIIKI